MDQRTRLAELYDAHAPGLYRYALMILADHAGAEDAVQHAFMGLIKGGVADDRVRSPLEYLRRSVRNQCFSQLRERARRVASLAGSRGHLLEPVAPDGDQPEERLALEQALMALPPDQREVVYLKVYEGLSFREIAALVDMSPNTAASRYRYAMEKLAVALSPLAGGGSG